MLDYPTVDNHETVDPGNDVTRYKSESTEMIYLRLLDQMIDFYHLPHFYWYCMNLPVLYKYKYLRNL